MYRVAVIQNESEMLRSGYANVTSKLTRIKRLSEFSFETFSAANIFKLFQEGDNSIHRFDSALITTNATSDSVVLEALQHHKTDIAEFIHAGKGMFVCSQKKLSTPSLDVQGEAGKTNFLPDQFEFFTVERPQIEKDSGRGTITIPGDLPENAHVLLSYPYKVTAEITTAHCEHNEFQRHFYRSFIVPLTPGAYQSAAVDVSYEEVDYRNLVMVNTLPQGSGRVVVSTIALDWAFHEEFLANIITYLTEGVPRVAFIGTDSHSHGDFDFLVTSAKLSKVPYEVYSNIGEISEERYAIHDTFVFSPRMRMREIREFLKKVRLDSQVTPLEKIHKQVYFFRFIDDILTMSQYSNYSAIDLMIGDSASWLDSRFNGRMWEGSFWKTYDILLMMHDTQIDIYKYIRFVFSDIKKHFKDYSYDGVVGVTCALLELVALARQRYPEVLDDLGFTEFELNGMADWILSKLEAQPLYDALTVMLTLDTISREQAYDVSNIIIDKRYLELQQYVQDGLQSGEFEIKGSTELDLCRILSFYAGRNKNQIILTKILGYLSTFQSFDGKWTNVLRTCHVLVHLLKNVSLLKSLTIPGNRIDDMIYKGVLFLRSEYDWKNGNWDNDLQKTAKAIHAIGLYNIHYNYSTQDFFREWRTRGR